MTVRSRGLAEASSPPPAAEEQLVKTTCWTCHGGCGIVTHVKDGRLVKVEGNPDDPYDEGQRLRAFACRNAGRLQPVSPQVSNEEGWCKRGKANGNASPGMRRTIRYPKSC